MVSDAVLRIGAWDADPEPSEPSRMLDRPADELDKFGELGKLGELEDGRGLALVRACADLWGWQPSAGEGGGRGKLVWCELAAA